MADFELFEADLGGPDESNIMKDLDSLATDLLGVPSPDSGFRSSAAYSSRLGYARLTRSACIEQSEISSYTVEAMHFVCSGEDRIISVADELELPENMDDADEETLEMLEEAESFTSIRTLGGIATTLFFDTKRLSLEKTVANSRLVFDIYGDVCLESYDDFTDDEDEDDKGFRNLTYGDLMIIKDIRTILSPK